MDITAARLFLQNALRGGSNVSQYTATILDQTIQGICNKFVLDTDGAATRTTGDLSLSIGASSLPSLAGLTGFRPEYMRSAYITNPPVLPGSSPTLHLTDYPTVLDLITNRAESGFPQLLAFDTTGTGVIYPIADAALTLRLVYQPPFTDWSAGTADAPTLATALNIPNEYLYGVLRWGGVYWLQGAEPENQKVMAGFMGEYDKWVLACKNRGIGTLGAKVSYRSDPRSRTRGRRVIDGVVR